MKRETYLRIDYATSQSGISGTVLQIRMLHGSSKSVRRDLKDSRLASQDVCTANAF